ncbi:MAG TPA: rhomboid family intramembrane serine protease [Thermoleophilaceae bacterium]
MIPLKDNIPTRRFPILTVALIAINVFVFVFLQHGGHIGLGAPNDNNLVRWGLIPYEVTHPGKHCDLVPDGEVACEGQPGVSGHASNQPNTWLTLFSSIFMHGGFLHIAGNMLFLWIFGNNIEDSMSRWRFALFYLLGGLVANFAQIAVGPDSTAPGIGASGAIAAVLGGYALLYPRARVITAVILIFFITLLDLPALLVLGAWFLLQLLDAALNSPLGGGVAYFAHIGGFLFGLLLIKLFANRVNTEYDQVNRLPVY